MKNTYILGVTGYPGALCHDGSAAILKDGVVLAAAEQERFSRRKHAESEAPYEAIRYCLEKAGKKLDEIDYIATGWSEAKNLDVIPKGESSEYANAVFPKNLFDCASLPPIYFVKHHIAHIMSSYFQSGFSDAACLVVDGCGEFESITLAEMRNDNLQIIKQYDINCSLGAFYDSAAKYCGLTFDDAGKLMGLAPYGNPDQKMPILFDVKKSEFAHLFPVSSKKQPDWAELQQHYLDYFIKNNYPYKLGDKTDIMSYINFAASAQQNLEDIILELVKLLIQSVKSENLIISGGVGLNGTANGAIDRTGLYKNIFIHPGTNDAGTSIGAALEIFRSLGAFKDRHPPRIRNVYLGQSYSDDEIENVIINRPFRKQKLDRKALIQKTASLLAKGNIVAWFQGGFEFGPRALGTRSFLANPTNRQTLNMLNNIKGREVWRPLSPIVLDSHYNEVFEDINPHNLSEFMLKTCRVKELWQSKLAAVTHIDKTSRPQVLSRQNNELLYDAISLFYKKTGIPVVVNTSFNTKGQPIINTPTEAAAIFENQFGIDALIMGSWLIEWAQNERRDSMVS